MRYCGVVEAVVGQLGAEQGGLALVLPAALERGERGRDLGVGHGVDRLLECLLRPACTELLGNLQLLIELSDSALSAGRDVNVLRRIWQLVFWHAIVEIVHVCRVGGLGRGDRLSFGHIDVPCRAQALLAADREPQVARLLAEQRRSAKDVVDHSGAHSRTLAAVQVLTRAGILPLERCGHHRHWRRRRRRRWRRRRRRRRRSRPDLQARDGHHVACRLFAELQWEGQRRLGGGERVGQLEDLPRHELVGVREAHLAAALERLRRRWVERDRHLVDFGILGVRLERGGEGAGNGEPLSLWRTAELTRVRLGIADGGGLEAVVARLVVA
eukprot:3831375-Prymnesium_polylepis.1